MGVISVRFNQEEERVLKRLSDYYDEDRSKLLKKSLMELYEALIDRKIIEKYETRERSKKVRFHTAEEVLKDN